MTTDRTTIGIKTRHAIDFAHTSGGIAKPLLSSFYFERTFQGKEGYTNNYFF